MPGGAEGQAGYVSEVTPGTAVTVTKFPPILAVPFKNEINYLDTETISARHTLRLAKPGAKPVTGTIRTELPNTTIATLWKHAFGTVVTTGTGPYTHTYTPGPLTGKSFTWQNGVPDIAATVHPFTYAGCKIATWRITANVDEIAQLEFGVVGMTETTGTALATASYDATWEPFTFVEGSVTIAGGAAANVRSVDIGGDNKVPHRVRLGSGTSKEPLQIGRRDYNGNVVLDFSTLTDYNRFVNGTESALVLAFNNGTETFTITTNVGYVGETPELSGFELVEHRMPFRCLHASSDASAITAVLVNSESSAA